jgi:hypothetical protein
MASWELLVLRLIALNFGVELVTFPLHLIYIEENIPYVARRLEAALAHDWHGQLTLLKEIQKPDELPYPTSPCY